MTSCQQNRPNSVAVAYKIAKSMIPGKIFVAFIVLATKYIISVAPFCSLAFCINTLVRIQIIIKDLARAIPPMNFVIETP